MHKQINPSLYDLYKQKKYLTLYQDKHIY